LCSDSKYQSKAEFTVNFNYWGSQPKFENRNTQFYSNKKNVYIP